jgi:hypothetical protein
MRVIKSRFGKLTRVVAACALVALGAHAIAAPPATPQVIGPVPITSTPGAGVTRDYPHFASEPYFNLGAAGYAEEEFFIQGFATRYNTPALADAVAVSDGHPFKTRILVRRPVDGVKFNGVVLVEWANVTSGYGGIDLHWQYSKDYLTRAGYVHVSVQAQRVGIHGSANAAGLRDWSPQRYSSLDVTASGTVMDDSLSYDIFSQVVMALKGTGKTQILETLQPKAYLAIGQSQSASRLTSYYNSVHPLHRVVDGFLVQVGGGPFRTDVKAPMIQVMSENEVRGSFATRRQPDSQTLRTWEVAGTAHVDYWWVMYRQALAVRDGNTPPSLACTPEPASHVPLRYVLNAGYHHLSDWVLKNKQPPRGEPIALASVSPVVIARDTNGIALGGIRQADVVVPIAVNRGDQPGITPGCPGNYGVHIPFSDAVLSQLYPTKAAYVGAVTDAVKRNVHEGFLMKEDGDEVIQRAKSSSVGTGRSIPIH